MKLTHLPFFTGIGPGIVTGVCELQDIASAVTTGAIAGGYDFGEQSTPAKKDSATRPQRIIWIRPGHDGLSTSYAP